MIPSRYRNAYKEVYIILSYLDEDDYNKIPLEVIDAIENNMNEEYEYYMNEDIDLSNQQMLLINTRAKRKNYKNAKRR